MPITTVNISGTLRDPSGAALSGTGSIQLRLNDEGFTNDGSNDLPILGMQQFPVLDGVVDFDVVPCTSITLYSGNVPNWIASYQIPGYPKTTKHWYIGSSDTDIAELFAAIEYLVDGGFENWSGTAWTDWNQGSGTLTQAEDTSSPPEGASAGAFTRQDGNYADVAQAFSGVVPGKWYRLAFWMKCDVAAATGLRMTLRNTTKSKFLDDDGVTWSSGTVDVFGPSVAPTIWTKYTMWIYIDETFALTDSYSWLFAAYFGSGNTNTYDGATFAGPYDKKGVG